MKRFASWATAAFMAAAILLLGQAPASAEGEYGPKTFFQDDPAFVGSDRNGYFTAQATYGSLGIPVAWSFTVGYQLQAIATSPMDCAMNGYRNGSPTGYHDGHAGLPVDYTWHSTVGNHEIAGYDYQLAGYCNFNVQGGFANLGVVFNYRIGSTGDRSVGAPAARGPEALTYSTTLTIEPR